MPDFLSTPIKDLTPAIIDAELKRSDKEQRDYATELRAMKRGLEARARLLAGKPAAETEAAEEGGGDADE